MDSDGTIASNGSEASFCSMDRGLAEGVMELVVSLGERCSLGENEARMGGVSFGTAFEVSFFPIRGLFFTS